MNADPREIDEDGYTGSLRRPCIRCGGKIGFYRETLMERRNIHTGETRLVKMKHITCLCGQNQQLFPME